MAASIYLRWEYHWANQYSSESLNLLAEQKSGADLAIADLQQANLSQAALERANLEGANLEAANLEGTILEGGDSG